MDHSSEKPKAAHQQNTYLSYEPMAQGDRELSASQPKQAHMASQPAESSQSTEIPGLPYPGTSSEPQQPAIPLQPYPNDSVNLVGLEQVAIPIESLKESPAYVKCPKCEKIGMTKTASQTGGTTQVHTVHDGQLERYNAQLHALRRFVGVTQAKRTHRSLPLSNLQQ
ncbi:hypothetical protein KEM54_002137 [Ascosphaera aggregata]|nr:hypothetical protein KEM54_002137 [Ascosphaera aggregata]